MHFGDRESLGNDTTDSDAGADGEPLIAPGTIIAGRYRVEECVGHGGMSEVYRAFQPALSRHVAVKVMRGGRSPRDVRRFTQEAETLGRLRHPGAVVAHDFGVHEDPSGRGHPFIVMELVRGDTLRARLARSGPLPPALARHVAREIAACVGAAHDEGVVHRDLKPTNVMLVPTSDPMRPGVRVLDFGIAKLVEPQRVSLSESGELVGSPRYMAPEQFEDELPVDARADIWTFGLLVHEMITGTHPVPRGASFPEVLAWTRSGAVALPEDAPTDLARLVETCLQPDRQARPATMGEAAALIGPTTSRRPLLLALLAALLVAVAATFFLWPSPTAPAAELHPVLQIPGEGAPTAYLVPQLTPFWWSTFPFYEAAAEGLGRPVVVYEAGDDAGRMRAQLRTLLAEEELGGVVVQSFEGQGPVLVDMAHERAVPVAAVNNAFERVTPARVSIRSDDERTGAELLEALVAMGSGSRPHVLAVHGPAGEASFSERRLGLERALHEAGIPATQLDPVASRTASRRAVRRALTDDPRIDRIWAGNDALALGAIDGARQAGREPGVDVFVGGVDWTSEGLDAIAEGELAVSLGGHLLEPGMALIALAAVERGGPRVEVRTHMRPATAANVALLRRRLAPEALQRIDYAALVEEVRQGRAAQALDPATILGLTE